MVLLPYKHMAKVKEREKAIELRVRGVSIADISTKLKVSKSTVSTWCKDIVLSAEAIQNIVSQSESKTTKALLCYTESLRATRQENIIKSKEVGKIKIGTLSDRDIYCIGLGIYWGEGYKKGSQEFGFSNSDVSMVTFYLRWLWVVFGVTKDQLILRVSINALHKSRIEIVEKFWSIHTGIPLSNFTRTSLIKTQSKKVYSNHNQHYGTLRIKVKRGTVMRREVMGAIEALATLDR